MENQQQNENNEIKENKENMNTKGELEWANKLDDTVKHNLAIVEQKIKTLKDATIPNDEFDDQALNKLGWFQQEINRISQENNLEYSYVQFVYNLVQEHWDNIDLNSINTAGYSSLESWDKYKENTTNSEKLISDISSDRPTLIFSNHHNILSSTNEWNKYTETTKNYLTRWTIPTNGLDKEQTKQTIEKEFFVEDVNNINDNILFEISALADWFNVDWTTKSEISSDKWNENESSLQNNNTYQSIIVSNLEIKNIDKIKWNSWNVKIKFNLYS